MAEMSVELLLAPELSAAQEEELTSLFAGLGIKPEIRRRFTHRGPAELDLLVLLVLPLQTFLSGLGSQLVNDVYECVKSAIRARKNHSRQGRQERQDRELVPLVLQDNSTGLRIVLESDLPAEAIRQLVALDISAYHIGPLHYDQHRHAWRSELDEATL
jgi:hypothetical protein